MNRALAVVAAGAVGLAAAGARAACPPLLAWSRTQNGTANVADAAYAVAPDGAGGVVVAGAQAVAGELDNWLIRAYDAAGSVAWSRTHGTTFNLADQARGIAVNGSGEVLAAGHDWFSGGDDEWLLRKFDAAGNDLWSRTFNGLAGAANKATGVAVGPSGEVVVCGWDQYAGSSFRWMARKYDSGGSLLWSRTYNAPPQKADRAYGVAVDPVDGSVVVVGDEERTDLSQGYNWLVRKYDANGNPAWSDAYASAGTGTDHAWAAVIDGSGNVFVAGAETRGGEGMNWLVRKYASGGGLTWSRSYNGAANGDDEARAVAVDSAGNVYVAGDEAVAAQGLNWLIRKYDPAGGLLWSLTYAGPPGGDDSAEAVAVSTTGAIWAGGFETRSDLGQGANWLVRKYVPDAGWQAALAVGPAPGTQGGAVTVTLTVTNTGCSSITGLTPSVTPGGGGALVTLSGGPTPAGLASLAAGSATSFSWSYALSAAGTLVFSASVSGYDPDLSSTVLASSAVPLTIQPASIPPPPPDFGNPLRLPGPGAALDRNAVDFTRGDVTLVRVHPLSGDPVTVSILTASGRLVRVLGGALDLGAGQFAMVWDGRTDEGRPVARGVYLVRVVGGGLRVTLKVVVRPGSP